MWVTGQPSSGTELPVPEWEAPRKGGIKKALVNPNRGLMTAASWSSQQRLEMQEKLKMTITTWNVRTMLDDDNRPECRTALISKELERYGVDIAALQEDPGQNHVEQTQNDN